METTKFNEVLEAQLERSTSLLMSKNAAYNSGADKLRNFKVAAGLRNTTLRNALSGMMAKHTVSIFDMCESDQEYPMEVWNEKITDHINYLLLLRAVVEEEKASSGMDYNHEEATKQLNNHVIDDIVFGDSAVL